MSSVEFVSLNATDWFMTLFTRTFSGRMDVIPYLWDLFLLHGWSFHYSVCLAMLKLTESLLMSCENMEESVKIFLKLGDYFHRAEVLIATALELKIKDSFVFWVRK